MTLRESVIELKGGGCETCDEVRSPALMVLVEHERTSSWERYWTEVHEIATLTPDVVRVRCRNCASCENHTKRLAPKATPVRTGTPKMFHVVRLGPNNEFPQWLQGTEFAVYIKNDGTYEEHPSKQPWNGAKFEIASAPFSYRRVTND